MNPTDGELIVACIPAASRKLALAARVSSLYSRGENQRRLTLIPIQQECRLCAQYPTKILVPLDTFVQ